LPLTHLIFDLDNTLYPPSRGVVERVDARITQFMVDRLGLGVDEASALRARYRDQHGTTLNGLMLHHEIAPDDYLDCVHEIAVDELLAPDPALAAMLAALPHEKVVFTNGSETHAERVLACLDVRAHFAAVFSLERVAYVPKPKRAAFEAVLRVLGAAAADCLFIDDRADNCATARALGMRTVVVGDAADGDGCDAAIASIMDLPALVARFDGTRS
jgi:putative hydrolase of the HAD superfamily